MFVTVYEGQRFVCVWEGKELPRSGDTFTFKYAEDEDTVANAQFVELNYVVQRVHHTLDYHYSTLNQNRIKATILVERERVVND
jgi:hypothetical protein